MRNPLNFLPIYKKPVIRALKSPSIHEGSPKDPGWVRRFFSGYKFKGLSFRNPLLVGIAFLIILTTVFLERTTFYQENTQWKTETQNAFLSKGNEISATKETLNSFTAGQGVCRTTC